MSDQAANGSLAAANRTWRVRLAVAMPCVAVAFGWQIACAEPISLPSDRQEAFRQAFYQAYSDEMARGGYYDALKQGDKETPQLRIMDCLHDRCLIDMVLDPGFNSALYLVKLDSEGSFYDMDPVEIYGRAAESAAFVTEGSDAQVYVTSVTHMGTRAAQLFAYDGFELGSQLALRTVAGEQVEDAEGDLSALDQAAAHAETLTEPVAF